MRGRFVVSRKITSAFGPRPSISSIRSCSSVVSKFWSRSAAIRSTSSITISAGCEQAGEDARLADEPELPAGEEDDGVVRAGAGEVLGHERLADAGRAVEEDAVARAAAGPAQRVGVREQADHVPLDDLQHVVGEDDLVAGDDGQVVELDLEVGFAVGPGRRRPARRTSTWPRKTFRFLASARTRSRHGWASSGVAAMTSSALRVSAAANGGRPRRVKQVQPGRDDLHGFGERGVADDELERRVSRRVLHERGGEFAVVAEAEDRAACGVVLWSGSSARKRLMRSHWRSGRVRTVAFFQRRPRWRLTATRCRRSSWRRPQDR